MRKPERARVAVLRKYFKIPADAWYWGYCRGRHCFELGFGRDLFIQGKEAWTIESSYNGIIKHRWLEQFMYGRCWTSLSANWSGGFCPRDHWLGETRFCRARTS